MEEPKKVLNPAAQAPEPSRREALDAIRRVAKYVAPATLMLVSGKSASASLV